MSLIIHEKNNIRYTDACDFLLEEDYFDYFEKDWFDENIFTCDLSILFHPITISEAVSKMQKEKG